MAKPTIIKATHKGVYLEQSMADWAITTGVSRSYFIRLKNEAVAEGKDHQGIIDYVTSPRVRKPVDRRAQTNNKTTAGTREKAAFIKNKAWWRFFNFERASVTDMQLSSD